MSETPPRAQGIDLEALLSAALRPVDPPEKLSTRLETTFTKLGDEAAAELNEWAEELTDSELRSLRDPRNWVRPVAAVAAGGVAGTALILMGVHRKRAANERDIGEIARDIFAKLSD